MPLVLIQAIKKMGSRLHSAPHFLFQLKKTYSISFSSLPISDGLRVTLIPHASMISNLASAVSAPPEINAPA